MTPAGPEKKNDFRGASNSRRGRTETRPWNPVAHLERTSASGRPLSAREQRAGGALPSGRVSATLETQALRGLETAGLVAARASTDV